MFMKIIISLFLILALPVTAQVNGQNREMLEYEVYFAIQKKLKKKYKNMSKEELHDATMIILEDKKRAQEENEYNQGNEEENDQASEEF